VGDGSRFPSSRLHMSSEYNLPYAEAQWCSTMAFCDSFPGILLRIAKWTALRSKLPVCDAINAL
jgi:hypothetical protein